MESTLKDRYQHEVHRARYDKGTFKGILLIKGVKKKVVENQNKYGVI